MLPSTLRRAARDLARARPIARNQKLHWSSRAPSRMSPASSLGWIGAGNRADLSSRPELVSVRRFSMGTSKAGDGSAADAPGSGSNKSDAELLRESIEELVACLGSTDGPADWHKAMGVLEAMTRQGVRPDISCYNVALAACIRADKLSQALELLETLGGRGLQPNVLSYNLIIMGCGRGGEWRRGMQLLDGMSAAGVTPDSSSFHGLMQACGKAKESGLIGDLIQEMEAKKVPISPVTYSTAIAALARCGAWDKARDLLRQMHDKGVEPSVACYHAAMFACGKPDPGRWMEAIDLLREMKARGLPVTVEAYNEAIFACGKAHEFEMGVKLLKEMTEEAGLKPNNMSFRGLIKGLTKRGDFVKCLDLLDEMDSKWALEPDVLVLTDAVEVFAKSSNPGATLRVLDRMKKAKQPDLRLYVGSLIRADELYEADVHARLLQELHGAIEAALKEKGKDEGKQG